MQETDRILGALVALRILSRKYEFRHDEERVPMKTVADATFPRILQIFQVREQVKLTGSRLPRIRAAFRFAGYGACFV